MEQKRYKKEYVTDVKVYRKAGAKIASVGIYIDIDSLYISYKDNKQVPFSISEFLVAYPEFTSLKEAKEKGYQVVCISKHKSENPIYLCYYKDGICDPINIKLCDENANLITHLPCQQYQIKDFSISPLLEEIKNNIALTKLHLVATDEGSIVIQATYLNNSTLNTFSKIMAIHNNTNYFVGASALFTVPADKEVNIDPAHKSLPILAKISIYGDTYLKQVLSKIRRSEVVFNQSKNSY